MAHLIQTYLPYLLSAITIYMTILAGNKARWAWAVGLGNQGLWLIWIIAAGAWGLIPMNIALWIVYARNHLRWISEQGAPVVPDKRVPPKNPQSEMTVGALRSGPAQATLAGGSDA